MVKARSFLFPFKYSHKVAYVVEFSHLKIRLYGAGHTLLGDAGTSVSAMAAGKEPAANNKHPALEIASPYSYADLWDDEEMCCKIQTIQHSDVLYIFNEKYPIKVLKRYAHNDWRLEDLELLNGPFLAMNTGDILVQSSGLSGEVTLAASGDLFAQTDIGRLMRLRVLDDDTKPWSAGISVAKGAMCLSDKKYYEAVEAGTTGAIKPVHSEGSRSDGGVTWKYMHDGAGIVKITGFTDSKHVAAMVIARLPGAMTEGTVCWELGMLHGAGNYPKSGAFFRNRFAFLANTPTGPNVCLSVSGDYNNFADMEIGEATAETAITVPVLNTEFNEGKWLYAGDVLFVGTGAAEFYIDSVSASSPMASDNVKISQISSVGSKAVKPAGIGGHIFFVDRYGLSLRNLMYNYYNDGYDQIDMSLLGKHLFQSRIVNICYQEVPDKVLWCLTGDGSLAALTFSAEQEVAALSRHDLSGTVESLAVIPNLAACCDELWLEVRRQTNGECVRTVEYMENGMPQCWPANVYQATLRSERESLQRAYMREQAMYLDAAVLFERAFGDTSMEISGLEHLEGCAVSLFADGAVLPQQVVLDGKVTVKQAYARVLAGLKITSQYIPQNIYIPNGLGSGIGQQQRINHVLLMLYMSGGGRIGESEDRLSEIYYRPADAEMGVPQALFSGNKEILFNGSTSIREQSATLMIENDSPLPMNILAIIPSLDV